MDANYVQATRLRRAYGAASSGYEFLVKTPMTIALPSATVPLALWQARPSRTSEAIGSAGLNAQSPSELGWRLRVEARGTPVASVR